MLGFLAQDMLNSVPEAVTTGEFETDMMGTAYTELLLVLANAVQKLKAANEAMKKRVEKLEGE